MNKKRFIALLMSMVFIMSSAFVVPLMAEPVANAQSLAFDGARGFNEKSFPTIPRLTSGTNNNWWDASVSGNGEIAFMESCDPNEDVFIFNNTKLVHDSGVITETPNVSTWADEIKASAMTGSTQAVNTIWSARRNEYALNTYGTGVNYSNYWPRPYQPAAQYRIKNNDYTTFNGTGSNRGSSSNLYGGYVINQNYNRYTNFETAEVGAQWLDEAGNKWTRRSFPSRADEVIVTYIEGPAEKDLNITLSIDLYREMSGASGSNTLVSTDNVLTVDENDRPIGYGMVGKYAYGWRDGTLERRERLFAFGGWATATSIVTDGAISYTNDNRTFGSGTSATTHKDPKITITGTKSVMLITKVDRIDTGCNDLNDVKVKLYDKLLGDINGVMAKYSVKNDEASYQALLAPHVAIHGPSYNAVKADFAYTEEAKADRALTNIELIRKQNGYQKVSGIPSQMNLALLERVLNAGRFGLLCSSGYQSARLGGIWNGQWNPQWSGDFTLNANTNIQVSAMNTANIPLGGDGYANLIVRMVKDWEINAAHAYGMKDAILAPPRVDGTGEGGSYHASSPTWPHMYVNALGDWLIYPMFEYYLTQGNPQIKVGKDIDLTKPTNTKDRVWNKEHTVASVLNLSEEDVARIQASGYMNLESDILYPMVIKNMNFWTQLVDERFYTESDGTIHVNDGTTLSEALKTDPGAKYAITPGFSPENTPSGWGGSLAFNNAVDIAAIRNSLFMARYILDKINPPDKEALLSEWAEFEKLVPDHWLTNGGAVKEWGTPILRENNAHRHVSHAFDAYPGHRAQDNLDLRAALGQSLLDRASANNQTFATESHDGVHQILIESRLKRGDRVERAMKWLMGTGYTNASMTTGHNSNRGSSFCTDSAHGDVGGIVESLLYSNVGVIEILPALMPTMSKGSIEGLRARNNTLVDKIVWDKAAFSASVTMTTDEDTNDIKLMCGLGIVKASIGGVEQTIKVDELGRSYIDLALVKGVSVTVDFETVRPQISISTSSDLSGRLLVGSAVKFNTLITPSSAASAGIVWSAVDAATGEKFADTTFAADGTMTIGLSALGKFIKVFAMTGDNLAKSNEVIVRVSGNAPSNLNVKNSTMDYGFGYYVIESADVIGYTCGSPGNEAIWKYSNVDFTDLKSIDFIRTFDGIVDITLYVDLDEDENKTKLTGYNDNTGLGTSRYNRYVLANVTVDPEKAVSNTMNIPNTNRKYNVAINEGVTGVHDLYVRIVRPSGTWGGNYSYMTFNYEKVYLTDLPTNLGYRMDGDSLSVDIYNVTDQPNSLVVFWAAYDENNKLAGVASAPCSVDANEIERVVIDPAWEGDSYRKVLYIWYSDTYKPYMQKIQL